MHQHFKAEQWVPFPIDQVFAFFSNPENLPRLMPAWQQARIEEAAFAPAPPHPAETRQFPGIVAGAGTTMTLSFRLFPFVPLRLRWNAEITEFVWNEHFCDVQHRGPFSFWRHCHRLSPERRKGQEGTLLLDEVEYKLPGGPLGTLAAKLGGNLQFRYIFGYRHRRTAELLPLCDVNHP
ncbi:MAG: SRPBCC family protein [Janthinobacterium lividum]